jgi:hypothetical protein
LLVFYMDVAKVDWDVAYVAIVVHVCCKLLVPCLICFFRRMLQVCLFGCCICFTHMSQLFYLMLCMFYDGFKCFSGVFVNVSDACFKCFICLQMYVASVVSGCFKSRSGVASPSLPSIVSPWCLVLLLLALVGQPNQRRKRVLPPSS